jgi:sugar/nucleoside kinase (ribokinase family)
MTDRNADVLVVGAVGIDTQAYPPQGWRWETAAEGALCEVHETVGQGGGYAARGYAALGYTTSFLGRVGDDADGAFVRHTFDADGIGTAGLITSGSTAHSVNIVDASGSRRSFYDARLHGVDTPTDDLMRELVPRARLLHVNIPDWTRRVLPIAHEAGVEVLVDVQDSPGPTDDYRLDFVRGADLLFASGSNLDDPEGYARWVFDVGWARLVVIGLGGRGCLVVPRNEESWVVPPVELPADPVTGETRPIVDTNGAGDSLATGIGSALVLDELPLEVAVERGLFCARWCCTLRGTSDGLLSRERLDRLIGR